MPSLETLLRIYAATNASPRWLLTGLGEKFGDPRVSALDLDRARREQRGDAPSTDADKREMTGPSADETALLMADLQARTLGAKATRPLTDKNRALLAASHLLDLDIPKQEREALADLVTDAVADPELRRSVLDFYGFKKSGKRRKK